MGVAWGVAHPNLLQRTIIYTTKIITYPPLGVVGNSLLYSSGIYFALFFFLRKKKSNQS